VRARRRGQHRGVRPLAWTAGRLREAGLAARRLAGLDRRTAVVAAVGSSFDLAKGIDR
jgi:hypothetical protein